MIDSKDTCCQGRNLKYVTARAGQKMLLCVLLTFLVVEKVSMAERMANF